MNYEKLWKRLKHMINEARVNAMKDVDVNTAWIIYRNILHKMIEMENEDAHV